MYLAQLVHNIRGEESSDSTFPLLNSHQLGRGEINQSQAGCLSITLSVPLAWWQFSKNKMLNGGRGKKCLDERHKAFESTIPFSPQQRCEATPWSSSNQHMKLSLCYSVVRCGHSCLFKVTKPNSKCLKPTWSPLALMAKDWNSSMKVAIIV